MNNSLPPLSKLNPLVIQRFQNLIQEIEILPNVIIPRGLKYLSSLEELASSLGLQSFISEHILTICGAVFVIDVELNQIQEQSIVKLSAASPLNKDLERYSGQDEYLSWIIRKGALSSFKSALEYLIFLEKHSKSTGLDLFLIVKALGSAFKHISTIEKNACMDSQRDGHGIISYSSSSSGPILEFHPKHTCAIRIQEQSGAFICKLNSSEQYIHHYASNQIEFTQLEQVKCNLTFALILHPPIVMSKGSFDRISSIINDQEFRWNPKEAYINFPSSHLEIHGMLMDRIPFQHPSQVLPILHIIRMQIRFNQLVKSCCDSDCRQIYTIERVMDDGNTKGLEILFFKKVFPYQFVLTVLVDHKRVSFNVKSRDGKVVRVSKDANALDLQPIDEFIDSLEIFE